MNFKLNTAVKCVHKDSVELTDISSGATSTVPSDIVLFTAGTEPSPLIQSLAVRKDKYGRILTSKTLQCMDVPCIFALGDCGTVENAHNPATAQVAMQQASTAAHNVLAFLAAPGDESPHEQRAGHTVAAMKEFEFYSLGEMLTLGDTNATITSLGGWVTLSGPIAALGRRAVYGVRMPTLTQTVKALISASAVTGGKLLAEVFQQE